MNPEVWYASACAIMAAQNAGRPFSYYDQTLPVRQRRGRPTNQGAVSWWR